MRRRVELHICRFTGGRFLERDDFRIHLLELRRHKRIARQKARLTEKVKEFALRCETLAELQDWLNTSTYIEDRARITCPSARSTARDFLFTNVRAGAVGNSHCAPPGKTTNWGGYKDAPRSYPGISCNIHYKGELRTAETFHLRLNDILQSFGIYTGTGGGGEDSFRYDCTIWEEQFPVLYRKFILAEIAADLHLCCSKEHTYEDQFL